MPNALAHMGVGRITGRALFQDADDKWLYFGCILPDMPWILQRVVTGLRLGVDALDLRLYVIVQASFFFCLILSLSLALLSQRSLRIFLLLAVSSLGHLLLDATQLKWANGVQLWAPFSWRLVHFGFYWPESMVTYLLSAFGLIVVVMNWTAGWEKPVFVPWPPVRWRWLASAGLLGVYLVLPLLLMTGPEAADNHYVATLRHRDARPGRPIAFDRCQYNAATGTIHIFTGETLHVTGFKWPAATRVSIRGRFVTADRVAVWAFHVHSPFRDLASFLGLALIGVLWFAAVSNKRIILIRVKVD